MRDEISAYIVCAWECQVKYAHRKEGILAGGPIKGVADLPQPT